MMRPSSSTVAASTNKDTLHQGSKGDCYTSNTTNNGDASGSGVTKKVVEAPLAPPSFSSSCSDKNNDKTAADVATITSPATGLKELGETTTDKNHQENQKSDNDKGKTSSTSPGVKFKLGRKGDPRMHRAVAIRLENPKMKLLDALQGGGFVFPNLDKVGPGGISPNQIMDEDNVLLVQRKNQLSRRLRLAKQSPKKSKESQSEMDKNEDSDTEGLDSNKRKCNSSSNDNGKESKRQTTESECMPALTNPAMAQMMLSNFGNHQLSVLNALQQQQLQHAVATAGMCIRANGIGSSETGGSSSSEVTSSHSNTSSSTGANKKRAADDPLLVFAGDMNNISNAKLNVALNLFRSEFASLMKRCLIMAGFEAERTEECDSVYLQFFSKAIKSEELRLNRLMSNYILLQKSSKDTEETASSTANSTERNTMAGTDSASILKTRTNVHDTGPKCISTIAQTNQPHNHCILAKRNEEHSHTHAAQAQCHGHGHGHVHRHEHEHEMVVGGRTLTEEEICMKGRHLHTLDGTCGHKAVIHKPEGEPPHVDFIVNGKVECYQGCKPMIHSESDISNPMWLSQFRSHEVGNEHTTKHCESANCHGCESGPPADFDPKVLDAMELNSDEFYSPDFVNEGKADDMLLSLLRL